MNKAHVFPLLLVGILILPAFPAAAEGPGDAQGQSEGSYTVKEGDTLWDISRAKLKDPFLWQRIWDTNRDDIKDPDVIFPGEKIKIPGGAPAAAPAPAAPEGAAPPVEAQVPAPAPPQAAQTEPRPQASSERERPFVERGKTILKKKGGKEDSIIRLDEAGAKKAPIATPTEVLAAGFVAEGYKTAPVIDGEARDGRDIFAMGDEIYLVSGKVLEKGEEFVAYRPLDTVNDPLSGRRLGDLVFVTGLVKVTSGRRDGKYLAVVEKSFRDMAVEDRLVPYREQPPLYEPFPKNEKLIGKIGYVAAARIGKELNAEKDIVYLNMGSDAGVRPGDKFTVRRSGDTAAMQDGHHYVSPSAYETPDVEVGHVQVLSVQPGSSTAMVLDFTETVFPGYRVVYGH